MLLYTCEAWHPQVRRAHSLALALLPPLANELYLRCCRLLACDVVEVQVTLAPVDLGVDWLVALLQLSHCMLLPFEHDVAGRHLHREQLHILPLKLVLLSREDAQLPAPDLLQVVLGQHAQHSLAQHRGGVPRVLVLGFALLQAAHVAGVPLVRLLVPLVARELHVLRVHDHYHVTAVHMRPPCRLILAHERGSNLRGEPANDLALSVDDPEACILM
mmetsp:Transcript_10996/g.27776  ORF Transcript_10996/g.27776 Transcript_10996/m.27776 type:complete len:217 (-) Transcript_10996:234-884(-)